VVPRDALTRYPDGSRSAFVVAREDGRELARERRVRVGRVGTEVEVLEGLESGDRVVVRGNEALRDGQAVRVVEGD
jgi:multidrug efflux pump subunit AcrA (membrane-fusion protein)